MGDRLLIVHGDAGPAVGALKGALASLPDARRVQLEGYAQFLWSDAASDRAAEIASGLTCLLEAAGNPPPYVIPSAARDPGDAATAEGEIAGVTYRIRGSGPPLVLLPLGLAASQWDPLLESLAARYCTITLGGAYVGVLAILEERGQSRGYLGVVAGVFDQLGVRDGARVLEVGCGSGVLCRNLARRAHGRSPIVGADVNQFLLREATALARRDGLADHIEFRAGNAEALPFADNEFEAVYSSTVLEEVHADRVLAEMVRVTKPGGRVGVVVRAEDVANWYNLDLSPDLKQRIERFPGAGVTETGCADGSLTRRFLAAGLRDVLGWVQLATMYPGRDVDKLWTGREAAVVGRLTAHEAALWHAAVARARAEGTLSWSSPFHCAVGTKPNAL